MPTDIVVVVERPVAVGALVDTVNGMHCSMAAQDMDLIKALMAKRATVVLLVTVSLLMACERRVVHETLLADLSRKHTKKVSN